MPEYRCGRPRMGWGAVRAVEVTGAQKGAAQGRVRAELDFCQCLGTVTVPFLPHTASW